MLYFEGTVVTSTDSTVESNHTNWPTVTQTEGKMNCWYGVNGDGWTVFSILEIERGRGRGRGRGEGGRAREKEEEREREREKYFYCQGLISSHKLATCDLLLTYLLLEVVKEGRFGMWTTTRCVRPINRKLTHSWNILATQKIADSVCAGGSQLSRPSQIS